MTGERPGVDAAGPVLVLVALGANLGDRAAALATASQEIAALPGTTIAATSSVEETAPLGPPGQPSYLNQMLAVATSLTPHALLDALLDIERRAGRVRGPQRWAPRTLDCDIVRFGGLRIDDERLTVPHPEIPNRDFWQREMIEIEAELAARARAS
ncbi:MAG: 2-amino-4-hydroxy-6-hydroxymethyldihydropteridine diphosphokinase [Gemmatimonadaceae bacterium]